MFIRNITICIKKEENKQTQQTQKWKINKYTNSEELWYLVRDTRVTKEHT